MRRIPTKVGRYRLGLSRGILLDRRFEHVAAARAKRLSSRLLSASLVPLRSLEVDRTGEGMTSGEFTVVNLYLDSYTVLGCVPSICIIHVCIKRLFDRAPRFHLAWDLSLYPLAHGPSYWTINLFWSTPCSFCDSYPSGLSYGPRLASENMDL